MTPRLGDRRSGNLRRCGERTRRICVSALEDAAERRAAEGRRLGPPERRAGLRRGRDAFISVA